METLIGKTKQNLKIKWYEKRYKNGRPLKKLYLCCEENNEGGGILVQGFGTEV